jgi:hypothetical protein
MIPVEAIGGACVRITKTKRGAAVIRGGNERGLGFKGEGVGRTLM